MLGGCILWGCESKRTGAMVTVCVVLAKLIPGRDWSEIELALQHKISELHKSIQEIHHVQKLPVTTETTVKLLKL